MVKRTYLFIQSSKSCAPNGSISLSMDGPLYGGTGVPAIIRQRQSLLFSPQQPIGSR